MSGGRSDTSVDARRQKMQGVAQTPLEPVHATCMCVYDECMHIATSGAGPDANPYKTGSKNSWKQGFQEVMI
eukprot:1159303-Pelagomonas_calceolata.AAC.1